MAELGRLPKSGDVVVHDGVRLTVVRTEGRRVARVRLTPPAAPPEPAPEPDK